MSSIGPELYQYFSYDSSTYYEYVNWLGRHRWDNLQARTRTRGRFVDVDVRYKFKHPKYGWIANKNAYVEFDERLNLVRTPYLDFLPQFLVEGRANDFISADSALAIARTIGLQHGIREPEATLEFRGHPSPRWLWIIDNYLTEVKTNRGTAGMIEVIEIDPLSGLVIRQWTGNYVPSMPSFVKR